MVMCLLHKLNFIRNNGCFYCKIEAMEKKYDNRTHLNLNRVRNNEEVLRELLDYLKKNDYMPGGYADALSDKLDGEREKIPIGDDLMKRIMSHESVPMDKSKYKKESVLDFSEAKFHPNKNYKAEKKDSIIGHPVLYTNEETKEWMAKLTEGQATNEPEKEAELWGVPGYDDCNMKIPVKYADVIRINLSYVKEKQRKELIEKFLEDLFHYPVDDVIKKWKGRSEK